MALVAALNGNLLLRMGAEAGWFPPWARTVSWQALSMGIAVRYPTQRG
jgi:hypothetical protein